MSKKTTFAVIADLHVDIMHDAEERLKSFLAAARAADIPANPPPQTSTSQLSVIFVFKASFITVLHL